MGNIYTGNDAEGHETMKYLIDSLLDVFFWIIEGALGLLPEWNIGHGDALMTLATSLATFDQYFPITDLFQIIGLYCAFYALLVWVRPLLKLAHLA